MVLYENEQTYGGSPPQPITAPGTPSDAPNAGIINPTIKSVMLSKNQTNNKYSPDSKSVPPDTPSMKIWLESKFIIWGRTSVKRELTAALCAAPSGRSRPWPNPPQRRFGSGASKATPMIPADPADAACGFPPAAVPVALLVAAALLWENQWIIFRYTMPNLRCSASRIVSSRNTAKKK